MWIFNVFTLLIALIAMGLSLAQFVTRHRPAVGVSDLVLGTNGPQELELIATVHNWGEIIGEQVRVTIGPYTYKNQAIDPGPRQRYIGELFPRQAVRFTEAIPTPDMQFALMEGDLLVKVEISYQNPIYRLIGCAESRQFKSAQTFWITLGNWGVMAPSEIPASIPN